MAIRLAPSAARHGIGQDRARFVVEHCPWPLYPPTSDEANQDVVFFLWADDHGIPLEVVGIELADGDLLVIHAMRMRRRYRDDYRRVIECQEH